MENPKTSVIDQFLVSSEASGDDYERFLLSMVFSDAAARATDAGAVGADAIQGFVGAWASRMGTLGWTLTQAGNSTLQMRASRSSATAPFSELLAAEVSREVPGSQVGSQLLTLLAGPTTQDATMLDLWWRYASATAGWLSFGFVQLRSDPAGPIFGLDLSSVEASQLELDHGFFHEKRPVEITGWQQLGTQVLTAPVSFSSRSFTAQLRRDIFDGQAAQVRAALGAKLADHYAIGA